MKNFPRYVAVLTVSVCLMGTAMPAWAGPSFASPNLDAALKALQAAKVADDPDPSLQEALKDLNKATNNAGGKRDKAIELVNEAVSLEKGIDKTEMVAKIDHAITELHEGMARGGRRWNER
jgi:ABC-type transporter Mla subunit MlaD